MGGGGGGGVRKIREYRELWSRTTTRIQYKRLDESDHSRILDDASIVLRGLKTQEFHLSDQVKDKYKNVSNWSKKHNLFKSDLFPGLCNGIRALLYI